AIKLTNPTEKKQMLKEGIFYLNRAITVYPEYIDALLLMGNAQWQLTNDINNTMPYYYKVLAINPNHQNTWQNCFIVLEQSKNVNARIQAYQTLQRYNPNKPTLYLNLGRALGREKNDLAGAQTYLEMGRKIAPNNYDILTNLGTLYGLKQNYTSAIEVLNQALQLQAKVAKTHVDLGLSYFYSGQLDQAKEMFDKAVQLDNTINRSQFPI
ncbi:MAG: tetratricopeptide repeat protein, partial [Flavobacteriales bacterium]|nr:tetratricopeptide repeat protein [Flavobacteriales bacterium]